MDTLLFLTSVLVAAIAPVLAISYLRPILARVLDDLCKTEGASEYWVRAAYLMAASGTLLLTMIFGGFDPGTSLVETLRRTLELTLVGVFVTVGIITTNVWTQVRRWLIDQRQADFISHAVRATGATAQAQPTVQQTAGR